MKEEKPVYLTFPMEILKDGIDNISGCMKDAMAYCLYWNYTKIETHTTQADDLQRAANRMGITFGSIKDSFAKGKKLHESIAPNTPKTSIIREMIFDFYLNTKTPFEVVCFLAFAGIRSILQRQPYTKITNEYLLGRMAGNRSKEEPLPKWIIPFTNRYQLDKIKLELQNNWGLKLYAYHTRGFYVSFDFDLETLIFHAEKKRKSRKEKALQDEKNQARQAALKRLKEGNF